jgi:drug/metabolite transporter (DMT)-like permease
MSLAPLLALAAAILWGASTVLGRFVLRRISFLPLTGLRIVVAIPPLALMAAWQHADPTAVINREQAVRLFLMALIPGFAALVLYYHGLALSRASRASVAELCFPATAVILNWYFLGAGFTMLQAAGFVLLSGAILSWEKRSAVYPA